MMLMRERSGRSGRRRGSQKPGTAIRSATTAGVVGTEGPTAGADGEDGLGTGSCACARLAVRARTTASAHIVLRDRCVPKSNLIQRPFPELAANISSPWQRASHIRTRFVADRT